MTHIVGTGVIHSFDCKSSWKGGLGGVGVTSCQGFETNFSAPRELNGSGYGTNPEELLLSASSTCFLITLIAILERMKIATSTIALVSQLKVGINGGFFIQSIHHFPTVTLDKAYGIPKLDLVRQAIHKAEQFCMVTNALKPNVQIEVTAKILVQEE